MLSFLNKYKWYRDADKIWHLNVLDKQLDIVSLPLCEKFKQGNRCSIGCPLNVENTCAKEVIKDYTFKERSRLDDYCDRRIKISD